MESTYNLSQRKAVILNYYSSIPLTQTIHVYYLLNHLLKAANTELKATS